MTRQLIARTLAIAVPLGAAVVLAWGDLPLVGATSVVAAAPLVLYGLGLVLIWRADGFLNLSQVQIGLMAAVIFDGLMRGRWFVRATDGVCGCVGEPGLAMRAVSFSLSALCAIAAATLLSWALQQIVFRRFAQRSSLMALVASVFVAQALAGVQGTITNKLASPDAVKAGKATTTLDIWGNHKFDVAGVSFGLWQLVLVPVAVVSVVAIARMMHHGAWGIALQATSQRPDRAATLGLNQSRVAGRAWLWAGLLAGVAGVLTAAQSESRFADRGTTAAVTQTLPGLDLGTLLLLCAALVIAGFVSCGWAALAIVVLSITSQAVQSATGGVDYLNASYVVVIGALLLLQAPTSRSGVREDVSGLGARDELRGIPHELAALDVVRGYQRTAWAVAAVIAVAIPVLASAATVSLLVSALIFALAALSLLVLAGWAGQVSLGQFGFAAFGAWAATMTGWSLIPALGVGMLAAAVAAVVVGFPALRLRGIYLAVMTLAFSVSATTVLFSPELLGRFLPGELPDANLFGLALTDPRAWYAVALACLIAATWLLATLRSTRFGQSLVALRANEAAAQALGFDPLRLRLGAFALSGALAGAAGVLSANHLGRLDAATFAPERGIELFLFTLLGGLGAVAGPLLGAAVAAAVTLFFTDNALIRYAGAGTGALLLLLMAPGGLVSVVYAARDRMLVRLAFRLGVPVPSLMGDGGVAAMQAKVPLAEKRGPVVAPGAGELLRYRPEGQWALARLGDDESDGLRGRSR